MKAAKRPLILYKQETFSSCLEMREIFEIDQAPVTCLLEERYRLREDLKAEHEALF